MSVKINKSGVYKAVESIFVNVGGVWKRATSIHNNVSNAWKVGGTDHYEDATATGSATTTQDATATNFSTTTTYARVPSTPILRCTGLTVIFFLTENLNHNDYWDLWIYNSTAGWVNLNSNVYMPYNYSNEIAQHTFSERTIEKYAIVPKINAAYTISYPSTDYSQLVSVRRI